MKQGINVRKGININHVNIENMGGRDQSQVKIKFKKFKKVKSVPEDVPKCHNDDTRLESSQQSSSPSDSSDQAWDRHCTLVPTQDNETRIPGEESD